MRVASCAVPNTNTWACSQPQPLRLHKVHQQHSLFGQLQQALCCVVQSCSRQAEYALQQQWAEEGMAAARTEHGRLACSLAQAEAASKTSDAHLRHLQTQHRKVTDTIPALQHMCKSRLLIRVPEHLSAVGIQNALLSCVITLHCCKCATLHAVLETVCTFTHRKEGLACQLGANLPMIARCLLMCSPGMILRLTMHILLINSYLICNAAEGQM